MEDVKLNTELINGEVRLYFKERTDWTTEYFTATCTTDLQNKAQKIAENMKAEHYNCSVATEQDRPSVDNRKPTRSSLSAVRDQVKAIQSAMGLDDGYL